MIRIISWFPRGTFLLNMWGIPAFFLCLGCRQPELNPESKLNPESNVSGAIPVGAQTSDSNATRISDLPRLRHSKGFEVTRRKGYILVRVKGPWKNASEDFQYALVPKAGPMPADLPPVPIIRVPVEKAVLMSTTDLIHIAGLGVLPALVGISSFKYVTTPAVRARIDSGYVREVGADAHVNLEVLLDIDPDIVFSYSLGDPRNEGNRRLMDAGIPVVLSGAYLEESALGRSEWIKFMALFFGRDSLAETLFADVERKYQSLADLTRGVTRRPTVFANAPFGGVWWMPGGRSYVARAFADAGADYLWSGDTTRGSLSLDFEAVYARAAGAEYWVNTSDWKTRADGLRADSRFGLFSAFRQDNAFNNNARMNDFGGNEIYEAGNARPDLVLADLIRIFHPELLPHHQLEFYRRLGDGDDGGGENAK